MGVWNTPDWETPCSLRTPSKITQAVGTITSFSQCHLYESYRLYTTQLSSLACMNKKSFVWFGPRVGRTLYEFCSHELNNLRSTLSPDGLVILFAHFLNLGKTTWNVFGIGSFYGLNCLCGSIGWLFARRILYPNITKSAWKTWEQVMTRNYIHLCSTLYHYSTISLSRTHY